MKVLAAYPSGGGDKPKGDEMSYRDPKPEELESPLFCAIWQAIKTWDINVPSEYNGYMGATGNHVCAIMDAVREPMVEALAETGHVPQVQTSGPQCKKCGAFTTKKRVESHGLCMKCELMMRAASPSGGEDKPEG